MRANGRAIDLRNHWSIEVVTPVKVVQNIVNSN